MLPLVEEDGIVYGQAPRAWCHSGTTALHPVVHLQIMDREGNVYLQKRSMIKHRWPGRWDMAVGGHVSYGEMILETLFREAAEELGLTAFNPSYLCNYVFETKRDRELVAVFAFIGHPNLNPDNAEVTEGRWWSPSEIDAALGKGIFTPSFEDEFSRVRSRLMAML
ncbi:MAG: NUDIX domain-containing protein [Bacteroidales bacterium]|jgi:isopentenyldiphosphate isomerase|nr:NUDIX domain-containing protein [Bacteroidales bacterium]